MSESTEVGPLTVSQITEQVKEVVEGGFAHVAILGEVSNVNQAASGHVYLTLKDEGAQITGVIWRSTATRLWFDITDGMEVLVTGRIVVYPPRGVYQVDIRSIKPRGVGSLRKAFEALRDRLAGEGFFDAERKRPIPLLPRRIGIVTSTEGAALRDILTVIRRRLPQADILISPASVQGRGAAEELVSALEAVAAAAGIDVIILSRGGGSMEDLWAFNEECLARAVAACEIPVITGIGHEIDATICDLVADVRAATPSAAAELVAPRASELRERILNLGLRLRAALTSTIALRRERLRSIETSYGYRSVGDRLRERWQRTDELSRRAAAAGKAILVKHREMISEWSGRIESLSPLRVLSRGFTVTTRGGSDRPLHAAKGIEAGDLLTTRFANGRVHSRVERVEEDHTHG
jgi:exodeoxyribonuclease VII large subunit